MFYNKTHYKILIIVIKQFVIIFYILYYNIFYFIS